MTTEEDRHGEEMLTHTTWRSDRRWKLLLIPSWHGRGKGFTRVPSLVHCPRWRIRPLAKALFRRAEPRVAVTPTVRLCSF